ncbi:hypothetical protein LINPERPRIM_LOCUS31364, partial [Linum perenne]
FSNFIYAAPSLIFLSSSSSLLFSQASSFSNLSPNNKHTQQQRNQTSSSPDDTFAATPPTPSSSSGSERRHRLDSDLSSPMMQVDAVGARDHRRLRILSINAAAICGPAAVHSRRRRRSFSSFAHRRRLEVCVAGPNLLSSSASR